jgi:hypothetical protein
MMTVAVASLLIMNVNVSLVIGAASHEAQALHGYPGVHRASRASKCRAKCRKTVQAFTVLHVPLEAPVMFRGLVGDAFQAHKMLGHH